jgi:hypothetical protein
MIFNIILGVLLFLLSIIVHESVHVLVARHYGHKAYFKWISSKSKGTIGFFGRLPGARIEYSGMNQKEYFWICLTPFPFGWLFSSLIIFVVVLPFVEVIIQLYVLIAYSVSFGCLCSFLFSSSDIRDYKRFKKESV